MKRPLPVIDADGHITETEEQVRAYMDEPYRSCGATFLAGGNYWDRSLGGRLGQEARDVETWIQAMDRGGMETAALFGSRMAFNISGRNQDDHVKNIAFLMNRSGAWSLSPAFDVTYSYNPSGAWTSSHQMSLNGKRDNFALEDFKACAKSASMKRGRANEILHRVQNAVLQWQDFAEQAGVPNDDADRVAKAHRTHFLG